MFVLGSVSAAVALLLLTVGACTGRIPAVCGDVKCDNGETCMTCPKDCGACPVDCGKENQNCYYISSEGDDNNSGKSSSTPWKTISKVNSAGFASGDAILFRSGDQFLGRIDVSQAGLTFGKYGGGELPIITAAETLTGWTIHSGSIYKAQASAFVRNLFADDVEMTLARYPNSGFLTVASKNSNNGLTTITATTGLDQPTGYWNGANIRIRTTAYTFETQIIGSYDKSTLTLEYHPDSYPSDFTYLKDFSVTGNGFYLDNKLDVLDAPGEWYCDPNTNIVYFKAPGGVNPTTLTVKGSVFDYGIRGTQSNILVQSLSFKYQSSAAVYFSGTTSDNRILSNTIFGQLVIGIQIDGSSSNYTIDGNAMQNLDGRGISFKNTKSTTISNNAIKNVGLVPGYGIDNEYGMVGISIEGGSQYVIRGNVIDGTGYIGIHPEGSFNLVENNIISNVMLKLTDGGGIYSYNEDENTFGTTWRNNVITNVVGNIDGFGEGWNASNGLYWDFRSRDMIAEGNTVINATSNCLFMQYASYNNTAHNNTFYNCGEDSIYIYINTEYTYGGNTITGNTIFSKDAGHDGLYVIDLSPDYHPFGTLDNNLYCHPITSSAVSRVYTPPSSPIDNQLDRLTLAEWRSLSGQDANSKELPKAVLDLLSSGYSDTILVNETAAEKTFNLGSTFWDPDGNQVTGSMTLKPYSSKILIGKL